MHWLKNKKLQRILLIVVLAVVYYFTENNPQSTSSPGQATQAPASGNTSNSAVLRAIENQFSDVQVVAQGTIIKSLPDDNKGSRHQRFLIEVEDNVILVAHNIDLAPYVPNIQRGQPIRLAGEFEWNDKGGVIHWTHHDPRGKHVDGWIDYEGKRYK